MNKKHLTIKEFAEIIGQDYLTATALVKLMVRVGAAKEVGKKSIEGQRGKPSIIYEIEQDFDLSFWQDDVEQAAPVVAESSQAEIKSDLAIPEVKLAPEVVAQ